MIIRQPLFILGNPRSGTTLLRLMLDMHSLLSIPPECGFLQWWYSKYQNWTKADSSNNSQVNEYLADLKKSKKIETWKLEYGKIKKLIKSMLPANYAELSSVIYLAYSLKEDKKINTWGDKNNYYIMHLGDLQSIYPDAYFIHIIRDGRDVACSYRALSSLESNSKYKPLLPVDIKTIAEEWKTNNESILNFLAGIDDSRKLLIKYEDLIVNPQQHLTAICNFIGIEFEKNMLNYYKTEKEPAELIDWKRKTLEPADSTNKDKYLTLLSQGEISEFNSIAQNILIRNGYAV